MGWMWSDLKKETPTDIAPDPPPFIQHEAIPPPPPPPLPSPYPPTPNPEPSRTLTRDELADAELQAFLEEFNAPPPPPSQPSSSITSPPHAPQYVPSATTTTPDLPTSQINHSSISPLALYPTSMSCRAAFDSAFYCQSLGGQFVNLYRYGSMRNCSDQWANFWFCMRTNRGAMGEEERKRRIQEHYRGRAGKYVEGPSSEDVWEIREVVVEGAFEGDLEEVEREMREREGELG